MSRSTANQPAGDSQRGGKWRQSCRDIALRSALAKRAVGVPTFTVPEAAALLSVSHEHLYRLIRADAFPAVRMSCGGSQGRYIVPAKVIDELLQLAQEVGREVDLAHWLAREGAPHAS